MRKIGIFFLLFFAIVQMIVIVHLLELGLHFSASMQSMLVLMILMSGWYIDVGSRREYTGCAIRVCDLPSGKYFIHHYGIHKDGIISAAIVVGGTIKLCDVKDYFISGGSFKQILDGLDIELIIKGSGANKKIFICLIN